MELLEVLFEESERKLRFDHVIFCPSTPPASSTRKGTFSSLLSSLFTAHSPTSPYALLTPPFPDHVNHQTDHEAVLAMIMQLKFAERWKELSSSTLSPQTSTQANIKVLPSLEEAFSYIENIRLDVNENEREKGKKHVFITGSIHLVGRALSLLEGVETV